MPTAYGYIRVSDDSQVKSGLSLDAQTKTIKDYFARSLKRDGVKQGQIFRDAAVSASRHRLSTRPDGSKLSASLTRGDHVIIAKVDRAFRSLSDFANTLDDWQKRGVTVHLLDLHVDTSTAVGKLIASVVAAVAEWESRRIGERNRDAKAVLSERGHATNGRAKLGFRLGPNGKLVVDDRERKAMRRVVNLRRVGGLTWKAIAERLNADRMKPRAEINQPRNSGKWTHQKAWRMFHAYAEMEGKKNSSTKRKNP